MYNFVIDCSAEELTEFRQITSLADYQRDHLATVTQILGGSWAWCLQAYIYLKERHHLVVTLDNKYDAHAINFAHSDTLINLPGKASEFIVCVQADYSRRAWAHFHIVQNKSQVTRDSAFLPLWIHPGLEGRDPRRTGVQKVAYAGQTFNNNLAATPTTWENLLAPHGITFTAIANDAWHDLSEIDVLIGVRSFDAKPYDKKPPSKLINAWHARIAFVGGHDSAYKQIGTPGEDYLLVRTPEETVAAIMRLRDEPHLYDKLVRNGNARAAQYTQEAIIDGWEQLLTGPILRRYHKWQRHRRRETVRFVTKRLLGLQFHLAKKLTKRLLKLLRR